MTDFATAYGARLQTARLAAGLSQTQLGELLGLLTGDTKIAPVRTPGPDRHQLRVIVASLHHVVRDLEAITGANP